MSGNRAAIYRRVSSTRQGKEDRYSLSDQLERCTQHAKANDLAVARDFMEVHSGGDLDERPEMSALREAIRKREIDVLVATKLDRLSRDQVHQSVIAYECDKYGVTISLVDEEYQDTPTGRFLRMTNSFVAEIARANIRTNAINGMRDRVRQGNMLPGWIPLYGYSWADEHKTAYVINPETAPVVLRIFTDVAKGKPIRRIALELTAEGVLTPKDYWRTQQGKPPFGKEWAKSTIWNLLNHPGFYGQHSSFRWERVERRELIPETGKTVKINEQRERQFSETEGSQRTLLAHAAPPIITPEIAEAVKRRLEFNQQTASRNNKHPELALLRGGLAKCGLCGGTMIISFIGTKERYYPVYRCGHSHTSGAERSCQGTSITVAKMDKAVWARAMEVIQNPKRLREEAEKRMSDSGTLSTIEGYQKTIAELKGREASLAEAVGRVGQNNGYGMDSLLAQLNDVGKEKEKTLKKLDKAQKEYRDFAEVQQRLMDVEEWCAVAATIDREFTFEEKRIILFGLHTRVKIYPHGHIPRYIIQMGNEEDDTLVPSLEEEEPEEEETDEMGKGNKAKRLRRRAEYNRANSVPEGKLIGLAKVAAQKLEDTGMERQAVLDRLDAVRANPDAYLSDTVMADLACECTRRAAADPARMDDTLRTQPLGYGVWGADQIDPAARSQMENALRLPVAVAGALMPDAHVGYGLPIGGVLATQDAVIPYAVGVDIACRMRLSLYSIPPQALDERPGEFRRALLSETRFGAGAAFERNRRSEHEVLDDASWKALPLLKSLQSKAQEQLGSSGTGNHFVEWGTLRLYADDPTLGLEAGEYLALLSHSGSRGVGFKIANTYTEIARRMHPALDKSVQHLAWLPLASEAGQEYWTAMELAGRFASANHYVIHHRVARAAGLEEMAVVENHHNYAWLDTLPDGTQAVIHRKGATPAGPGVLGVIPGSMGDAGYVVRGRGEVSSLQSAAHGAGRRMSRKAAINSISKSARDEYLRQRGITLLGGGMDESPQAYKDIEAIIAAQDDLVEVIGKFTPRIVRMADEAGEY